jgi:xanthine dehydrogenase YagR molybdenum-binding subunit
MAPTVVGRSLARIDGPLKVSGAATYTSDHAIEGMAYAVPVGSTIANGRVASLDLSKARDVPGVIEIYHRGNIGALYKPSPDAGAIDEARPPFADDVIRYYGQYVALVVAETFEDATAAASLVDIEYADVAPPNVGLELVADSAPTVASRRGNPEAAYDASPIKIDRTYVTPAETHNPIELHASLATYDGEAFTLYETTQAVVNHRNVVSEILGVPRENVRIIMKFLGSGFGGKLWPWTHGTLAAAAARNLGRPVKLVVTRRQMFQSVGHRARTQQRVRMSARPDGTLTSLRHEAINDAGVLDEYDENCGEATPYFYGTPNLLVTSAQTRRHVGAPTAMRGPGAVPGLFATESAYDELAIELGMDPVQLRLHNEPERDQDLDVPFSSRHYAECLALGAEKFGWAQRSPQVGAMRTGDTILGWGMSGCSWIAGRFAAEARVELRADGSARVAIGTQDIGTGTYTVLAQIVADATGIPVERIVVDLGDTRLPPGPTSGGSLVTSSVIPAVLEAVRAAMKSAIDLATTQKRTAFEDWSPDDLSFEGGRIVARSSGDKVIDFQEVLQNASVAMVSGTGKAARSFGDEHPKYSLHSYGAHFVEVAWQPAIARLRVNRVVTVIDAGRIINPRTARNQIEGAIVMGVGMALFEETRYDPRTGAPINGNLADYVVATNADTPQMDVTFLDYPDTQVNELGARGVGEIGLAGVASAIASATYHATGLRVRTLPIEIEKLLGTAPP